MMLINRDAELAVVLLSNTAFMELDKLAEDVIHMLSGEKVKSRSFETSVPVSREVMERYVGQYKLAPGFVFSVSVKDGKLMVGLSGQPTVQVLARSDTEWFYAVVDATLKFQVDADGKCISLQLLQNGLTQTADKTR